MEMAPVSAGAILHAGCGTTPLPDWLDGTETRLDIDGRHAPDIVASMTRLGDIGPYDFVYCSHALEHLYPHDALAALREFRRVLREGGAAFVCVPNLEGIQPTFDTVYTTASGQAITGFHMFYGDIEMIEATPFMAHRSGFVASTLENAFQAAGFSHVTVNGHSGFNLIGLGIK